MAKLKRSSVKLNKIEQKQDKQQRTIQKLEKKERFMKWVAIGILILILLALLTAGYATDWTRGLNKNPIVGTSLTGGLDSAGRPISGASGSNGTDGSGSTTTSTTTNNSSTTNNSTTNPGDTNSLLDELLNLYNETGAGDNINDIIDRATALGISVDCNNELLVQNCVLSVGDSSFTVRNLLGTGLITGVFNELNLN